jgi:L-alanine-DL-glutamate epimerase-like enolase superfamily enzyme
VRGYASGGWAPGEEAEAELAGYAAKGFSAAKMRVVGRDGFSIANCVRRVKAARRGLGRNVELMIDAHGSLEVATAIKLARELEPYDIAWFEEPVSRMITPVRRRCADRRQSLLRPGSASSRGSTSRICSSGVPSTSRSRTSPAPAG